MPYSLRQLPFSLLLAQQSPDVTDPELMKITPGRIAAVLLLLSLACISIAVGIKWIVQILQHTHPIAAVNRGILRVPLPLTICTAVVTGLLLLLVWLTPAAPQDADIPLPPGTAAATEPVADVDQKQVIQAWQMLISTVLMNAFILAGLGIVVIIAGQAGRYRLAAVQPPALPVDDVPPANVRMWADLNDAPVENGPSPANAAEPHDVPCNPESTAELPAPPSPFSLFEELFCAAEVTLAAYFPTMLLRLTLVLLIQWFTGEEAPSNPLLDMITSGAGGMLLLCVIFTGVVVAPVVEELQFRVVLLGGLLQAGLKRVAVASAAISFSLLHGFPDGLALLPLAFALGYAYMRRQSYLTVIFVHFMFNAINLGIAFMAMG